LFGLIALFVSSRIHKLATLVVIGVVVAFVLARLSRIDSAR
jgi:hypothetical protein